MAKINISDLNDDQKLKLVQSRWDSSSTLWETIKSVYQKNTAIYENKAEYLSSLPERRRRFQVQANRIFVNMEAVINSLIANPPGINILPGREGQLAQDFSRGLEKFMKKKLTDVPK